MAADTNVIRDQLRHAQQTGDKSRAAKLRKILKAQEDYEAGKGQRTSAGQRANEERQKQRNRKRAESGGDFGFAERPGWRGGTAMILGDPKLAKKQKRQYKFNKAKNSFRDAGAKASSKTAGAFSKKREWEVKHAKYSSVNVKLGLIAAGVGGTIGGAHASDTGTRAEHRVKFEKQHGKASDKRRRKIRLGNAVMGAGVGATNSGLFSRYSSTIVAFTVVGGAAGYLYGRHYAPNNRMDSKNWVTYKKRNGQYYRVVKKNPYYKKPKKAPKVAAGASKSFYYRRQNNKQVRVRKGKRK